MKIYKYISLVLVAAMCSCSGFLREEPKDRYIAETYFDSDARIIQEVNGCYKILTEGAYYGNAFRMSIEFYADSYSGIGDGFNGIQGFGFGLIHSDHPVNKNMWDVIYRSIGRCNTAIYRIENSTNTTEDVRNRCLAEVRFLRALHYYNLVRCWGEVPLRTEYVKDYQAERSKPLASRYDIFDQIIKDLKFAKQYCWNFEEERAKIKNSVGRATSLAATTLLAKVYLHVASSVRVAYKAGFKDNGVSNINAGFKKGFTAEDAKKYYELCRDECLAGVGSPDFFMETNFADLWKIDKRFSKEFLFATQYYPSEGYYSDIPNKYLPKDCRLGTKLDSQIPPLRCKLQYLAHKDAASGTIMLNHPAAIDTCDVRMKEGFMGEYQKYTEDLNSVWKFNYYLPGTQTLDLKYRKYVNGVYQEPGPDANFYFKKYQDPDSPNRLSSRTGAPILRSVDLYLMLGESLAEIAESPSAGYEAFKNANKRAATAEREEVSDLLIAKFPGSSDMERFREYVMRERMLEFAAEGGDRMATIIRMGCFLRKCQDIEDVGITLGGKAGEKLRKWYHYVWPISQDEVNGNDMIEGITPGY